MKKFIIAVLILLTLFTASPSYAVFDALLNKVTSALWRRNSTGQLEPTSGGGVKITNGGLTIIDNYGLPVTLYPPSSPLLPPTGTSGGLCNWNGTFYTSGSNIIADLSGNTVATVQEDTYFRDHATSITDWYTYDEDGNMDSVNDWAVALGPVASAAITADTYGSVLSISTGTVSREGLYGYLWGTTIDSTKKNRVLSRLYFPSTYLSCSSGINAIGVGFFPSEYEGKNVINLSGDFFTSDTDADWYGSNGYGASMTYSGSEGIAAIVTGDTIDGTDYDVPGHILQVNRSDASFIPLGDAGFQLGDTTDLTMSNLNKISGWLFIPATYYVGSLTFNFIGIGITPDDISSYFGDTGGPEDFVILGAKYTLATGNLYTTAWRLIYQNDFGSIAEVDGTGGGTPSAGWHYFELFVKDGADNVVLTGYVDGAKEFEYTNSTSPIRKTSSWQLYSDQASGGVRASYCAITPNNASPNQSPIPTYLRNIAAVDLGSSETIASDYVSGGGDDYPMPQDFIVLAANYGTDGSAPDYWSIISSNDGTITIDASSNVFSSGWNDLDLLLNDDAYTSRINGTSIADTANAIRSAALWEIIAGNVSDIKSCVFISSGASASGSTIIKQGTIMATEEGAVD